LLFSGTWFLLIGFWNFRGYDLPRMAKAFSESSFYELLQEEI
jgi:hypothetical protein